MNTQVLRYVMEVERTGSISKAADNLYMSQPNLSKAIRELESALNITIFHRTTGGVFLTQKGRELIRHAQKVLQQVDAMEALYLTVETETHAFRLSAPHTAYISKAYAAFTREAAQGGAAVDFHYTEVNSVQAVKNVVEDQSNLGILRFQTAHERYFMSMISENGLEYQPVAAFNLRLLLSREHPLAARDVVRQEDLGGFIELAQNEWSLPSAALTGGAQAGRECKSEISVTELGTRLDLLCRLTNAYLLAPPTPSDLLDRLGVVEKRLDTPGAGYRDVMIYRAGYRFTTLDEKFSQALKAAVTEITC